MQKLAKSDLLVVVDTSANGISGSPTGETMAIEAGTLAGQLAEIQQGDVGISLFHYQMYQIHILDGQVDTYKLTRRRTELFLQTQSEGI